MFTYKAGTGDGKYQIFEAEYFKMLYDGVSGVDAHFFVRKDVSPDTYGPPVWEEILVGYANRPDYVVLDVVWVPSARGGLDVLASER